ncbi:reducing type I polyketide synthase [Usnea florida]
MEAPRAYERNEDESKSSNATNNGYYESSDKDILESLAVVGLSLRFPQDATSPESLWKMLMEGRCAMGEVPEDRWKLASFYHPDGERKDCIPARGGHFLDEDISAFDAPFFSISPAEAAALDPQQRLLLETSYRALENAGIPLDKVRGSKTSVFTGSFTNDYLHINTKDTERGSNYDAVGLSSFAMLANRLSWFFNFSGPSVNLDSACSSSLTALDLACQCLRNGDAAMALVAGCNLVFNPDWMLLLSNMSFLSHDSRCFSFDHRANGYARGEGVSVVVIKRLSDAVRDGDTIRAVIRSTGSNQDGRTPGITQPDQNAQETLIRETYQKAGLDLSFTRYVEAHGTGTVIGDPTEARALGRAFRQHRSAKDPLFVGAVKSNIGHLEGASGLAGFIKAILVLERGIIPPNTNFEALNPNIDLEFLKIKLPLRATPWPVSGLRRASVNSFGFGGSNSHVVLDDACNYLRRHNLTGHHCSVENPPVSHTLSNGNFDPRIRTVLRPNEDLKIFHPSKVLILSSADEGGVYRLGTVYGKHFTKLSLQPEEINLYMANLAYTLNLRRSFLSWKSFIVASSPEQLHNMQAGLSKPICAVMNPGLGFIFNGQGAQWFAMGRELLSQPVFKESIEEAELHFSSFGCSWSLIDELLKTRATSNVDRPEFSQPICTALQVALVNLLRALEVHPSVVVGHSSGEIAAAYSAGALSSLSAYRIAYYRGLLAASLVRTDQGGGSMSAIALSESQVLPYLDETAREFEKPDLHLACINSPKNVTVSGEDSQIDYLDKILARRSIFARKLKVDVAYHSPRMNEIVSEYMRLIQGLENGEPPARPVIFISSVTGTRLPAQDLCRSDYWCKNMVSPVRFAEALGQIHYRPLKALTKKLDGSHKTIAAVHDLLEIGPHSALQGPILETLRTKAGGSDVGYMSMLKRHVSAVSTTLEVVGHLHCSGHSVNLHRSNAIAGESPDPPDRSVTLTDLPEYPFDHSQKHWHESRTSRGFRFRASPRLELLGSPVADWNPLEARWRNVIKVSEIPWIADHRINGSLLYPAAGMLVMAVEAANQMADKSRFVKGFEIQDVLFHRPLTLTVDPLGVETMFYLRPVREAIEAELASLDFKLCMYKNHEWVENCRGIIKIAYKENAVELDNGQEEDEEIRHYRQLFDRATLSCAQSIDSKSLYEHFQELGYGYGPTFQLLEGVRCGESSVATAEVKIPYRTTSNAQAHIVHPTSLDAMMQTIFAALTRGNEEMSTMVPTRARQIWVSNFRLQDPDGGTVKVMATSMPRGHRGIEACVSVLDGTRSNLLLQMEGLEMTIVSSSEVSTATDIGAKQTCSHLERKPAINLLESSQTLQYCENFQYPEMDPIDFFEDLTLLLLMFVSKALESVATRKPQNLDPHYQRYIEWMQKQLETFRNGQLPHSNTQWMADLGDAKRYENLCKRISEANKQGKLYTEVGQNLIGILSGTVDPLDVLFKGDLARDFFHELNNTSNCSHAFGKYLDAVAHEKPRMRILEIGAGTGSMTGSVLRILTHDGDTEGASRFDCYDFTDISPSFFEDARKTFMNDKRIHFRVLDIEKNPVAQGFDAGEYDMIIASNVLHATRDLSVTVDHVRTLLKPGGKLTMFEVTEPQILRAGFVFGLLPGWWLAMEEYRQWSPCVSTRSWHEILTQHGFSGTDIVLADFQNHNCHESSIIVSTAVEEPRQEQSSVCLPKTMIVVAGHTADGQKAQQIKTKLQSLGVPDLTICPLQQTASMSCLDEIFCIFLCELEKPLLYDLTPEEYHCVRRLLVSTKGTLWVTKGEGRSATPSFGMIDGLSRVLRTEIDKGLIVTLAIDVTGTPWDQSIQNILKVFTNTVNKPSELEYEPAYTEIDGLLHIDRIVESIVLSREILKRSLPEQSNVQSFGGGLPMEICIKSPGSLETLCWVEDTRYMSPLAPDELEVQVQAVGLNFMDCLAAHGQGNFKKMGTECAGVVTRVGQECNFKPGERVCVANLDLIKSFARSGCQNVARIPDGMSNVEAAALPTTFITAYYSLHQIARLRSGESILIHSGAGGTGQAAIQVAQYFGADVFTTVGSKQKKRLLMDLYHIPEDHIFYSRNTSFAQGVKRMTRGNGVDVVLNSLSGDRLVASWKCVAPYGRFLEIGKKDIYSHQTLPMFQFAKNVTFSAIDIASMELERPWLIQEALITIFDLVMTKKLRPAQPLHVYKTWEFEQAFRFMQSGQNDGKIVVEFGKEDQVPTVLTTKPSFYFTAEKTYLIGGGLGGLGRSIALWMVSRGAKNLILLSRSGVRDQRANTLLERLEAEGARVVAPACDMTNALALKSVIDLCAETMPPIAGCIQASMVLRDALFAKMSYEDWRAGTDPKAHCSWNLHTILPKDMDFFILLSSICGIMGQGGQANYAAGNTYQDALARHRVAQGEKAVSIDLGVMVAEGFLRENETLLNRMLDSGLYIPLQQRDLFALLDYYCDPALDILTPQTCQTIVGIENPASLRAKGVEEPPWMQKPLFSHTYQVDAVGGDSKTRNLLSGENANNIFDFRTLFASACSLSDAAAVARQALIKKLSQSLGSAGESIDPDKPLHSYGVDSLLAIELRTWIAREFAAEMAVFEILGGATVAGMGAKIARTSALVKEVGT